MTKASMIEVRDFVEREFESIEKGAPLSALMGKLRKKEVQEAVVMDGKRAVGVMSYDMLLKRRNLPANARIEHLMVSPPVLSPDNNLIEACEVMFSSGLRICPVEERKALFGVVTRRSIMKLVPSVDEVKGIKAAEIMSRRPLVVREDDDVMKVMDLMSTHDIRAVPVVDSKGLLIGAVGIKDIASLLMREKDRVTVGDAAGNKERVSIEVKSIMHRNPIYVGPESTMAEISALMTEHHIGGVIITEDRVPVGIVHQIDIIESISNLAPREGVYVQISGLEEDGGIYEDMYSIIEKYMKKIADIVTPRILNIHVVHHHDHEGINYTIRLRMSTEKTTYYAKTDGWNIFRALTESLEDLEKQVMKDKERFLDERRRRA